MFADLNSFLWYSVRAAGITSYLLFFATTALGIMLSTKKIFDEHKSSFIILHRLTSMYSLAFILMHFLMLLFLGTHKMSLVEVLIPFVTQYQSQYVAMGIMCFYLIILTVLTSLLLKRIGKRRWKQIHLLSYIGFVLSLIHAIFSRPESNVLPITLMYIVTSICVGFLVMLRLLSVKQYGLSDNQS